MVNPQDEKTRRIREFWDERSTLGERAGTNDVGLAFLEQAHLLDVVPAGANILDVGCGAGRTLVRLAWERSCSGMGVDASEGMVIAAKAYVDASGVAERLAIARREATAVGADLGLFDVAYTQRCLINLTSAEDQYRAVFAIGERLAVGGLLVMIESSIQGGENTNALRRLFGLQAIHPPWHNLFFDEDVVSNWSFPHLELVGMHHISSTYHLLSRVVYAAVAAEAGESLAYDSPINRVALRLPPELGEFGPVKAWHFRRR